MHTPMIFSILARLIFQSVLIRHAGGTLTRRLLLAPTELEEQRGCAVQAYHEWLAPLASRTKRYLVVPNTTHSIFNFSRVASAWKTNCGLQGFFKDGPLFRSRYSGLCRRSSPTAFFLRIEKDWSSGSPFLVDCAPSTNSDRCVRMRGNPALSQLTSLVPELEGPLACLVITHAARGFKAVSFPRVATKPSTTSCNDNWPQLDFTDAYQTMAQEFMTRARLRASLGSGGGHQHSSLSILKEAKKIPGPHLYGPHRDKQPSTPERYASLHLRTEKWAESTATSARCWSSLADAVASELSAHGLKVLFIGADVGHSFSYSGLRTRQALVAARLHNDFITPLQAKKFRVVLGSDCTHGQEVSAACAVVDQLTLANADVFLHLYSGTLSACSGAGAGSCYGQWILRHREWKQLPSLPLDGLRTTGIQKKDGGLLGRNNATKRPLVKNRSPH